MGRCAQRTAAYRPKWVGECEGYATKFMRQELWRVEPDLTLDDLLQEARFFYLICEQRYKVKNVQHFMALFKRCLFNRVCALAKQRTKHSNVLAIANRADDANIADLAGYYDNALTESDLRLLLVDAPDEILTLVETVMSSQHACKPRRYHNGKRETTNEYLRRLACVDNTAIDMRTMLADFINGKRRLYS